MNVLFADLHLHTHYSDGTYTPHELAAHAQEHGLAAIALTDHDTVEGCAPLESECKARDLEFIAGTELTAEVDDQELHLIGYLFDIENPRLLAEMLTFQTVRQERVREMVARLNKLNVPLDEKAVFALANCRSPGRPHVARALVQAGLSSSMDEAFERFLKKNRPAWVPKFKISAQKAIELIHEAGGVAIMAHPGLNRNDQVIPQLIEQGLDGLECFHSKHSTATSQRYVQLAEENGLLITGGSDCHGLNKGQPLIGSIKLPYQYVIDLKKRAAELRAQLAGRSASR